MTSAAHLRKGWCPGALRPMRSGDGLLVRVRPRAGAFGIPALRAIAGAAARFGSGEIDLTNRGNLQLRGVSDETHDTALAALDAAGLLDQSAAAEAVRNVVVDPLSGIDPSRADVRQLAANLESVLVRDQRFWALPGKFGFSFSGVPEFPVGGRSADIMIASDPDRFAICLDGAPDVTCGVSSDKIVAAAQNLALVFLQLRENDSSLRRMRDVVARIGAVTVFAMAALHAGRSSAVRCGASAVPVGQLLHDGKALAVGIGLPFGRIIADVLGTLCETAAAVGIDAVHTSPDRVLILPVRDSEGSAMLLDTADSLGLITTARDVRLSMDVCPGAPACCNATTDTRGDAERLVESLGRSLRDCSLHVSGCEKGCARNGKADFTVVARHGDYDLICDGIPGDPVEIAGVKSDQLASAIARCIMEPTS